MIKLSRQDQLKQRQRYERALRGGAMADEKKLKLFRVNGTVTISIYTVVAAADDDEAQAKAVMRGIQELCYECSSSSGAIGEWRTNDGFDGMIDLGEVDELDPDDVDTEYTDYLHDEEAELNDVDKE